MKCNQIKTNLTDYLHNRLDPELRQTISEHLRTCQDCCRELDFLRAYFQKLPAAEPVLAPVDFLAQVRRKTIDAPPAPKWNFTHPRLLKLTGAMTGLALVCLIVFLVNSPRPLTPTGNLGNEISKNQAQSRVKTTAPLAVPEKPVAKPDTNIALAPKSVKSAQPSTILPVLAQLTVIMKVVEPAAMKSMAEIAPQQEASQDGAANRMLKAAPPPVASKTPDLRMRLQGLIHQLGGQVVAEANDPDSNRLQKISFLLPAARYGELYAGLNNLGQIAPLPATPPDGVVTLRIDLQLEYL